jgi:glycosyltransferase involved in cell wall biosynthesis
VSSPPRFSVVIPFYDVRPWIGRCVEGLLAQDYPADRFEILMVDNNSTDGSAEVVRRHPRVTLLREEKQGAYAARNRGVAHAVGELVAFTDPDCVPRRDWLRRLDHAFRDPPVQIVMGRAIPAGAGRALALLSLYEHHKDRHIFGSPDPLVYYGHTNNLTARREALEAFGPFVERRRGADVIFTRRTVEAWGCDTVRYEPRAIVDHLEIDALGTYYRKIFVYGRSRRNYSRIMPARPLSTRERLTIWAAAVRGGELGPAEAAKLLALLGVGVGCWYAGALSALRPEPARASRGAGARQVAGAER